MKSAAARRAAERFQAQRVPMTVDRKREQELLIASARLAREQAPRLCWRHPETGAGCVWMHRFWSYLRLFGFVGSPDRYARFFRHGFDGVTAQGERPRVLVSGTADYSMLAEVFNAFDARGLRPDVTVLDRCGTPVMLSRWYAEQRARPTETVTGDILDYAGAEPFDAICTSSFVMLFPPERRLLLLRKWLSLLRPGGKVITNVRLQARVPATQPGFTPAQARALLDAVREGVRATHGALGVDEAGLMRDAEDFIRGAGGSVYPVLDDVRRLFADAGYRIEQMTSEPAEGGRQDLEGPTLVGTVERACVIASRP
jgi:hypothetical protein